MLDSINSDFLVEALNPSFPSLESIYYDSIIASEDESPSAIVKIINFIKMVLSYIIDIVRKMFRTICRTLNFLVMYFTNKTHVNNMKDFTQVIDYIIRVKEQTGQEDALKLFLEANEKSFKSMHISLLMLDELLHVHENKDAIRTANIARMFVESRIPDYEFLERVEDMTDNTLKLATVMKKQAKKNRKQFMIKELGTNAGKYCDLSSESWYKLRELNSTISARSGTIYNMMKRINDVGKKILSDIEERMELAYERLDALKRKASISGNTFEIRQEQRMTAYTYNRLSRIYSEFATLLNSRTVGYNVSMQMYDKYLCKIIKSLRKMLFNK